MVIHPRQKKEEGKMVQVRKGGIAPWLMGIDVSENRN